VFDLNLKDKKGMSPLHYAVEKQDHSMFMYLLKDANLDIWLLDEEYLRAK